MWFEIFHQGKLDYKIKCDVSKELKKKILRIKRFSLLVTWSKIINHRGFLRRFSSYIQVYFREHFNTVVYFIYLRWRKTDHLIFFKKHLLLGLYINKMLERVMTSITSWIRPLKKGFCTSCGNFEKFNLSMFYLFLLFSTITNSIIIIFRYYSISQKFNNDWLFTTPPKKYINKTQPNNTNYIKHQCGIL